MVVYLLYASAKSWAEFWRVSLNSSASSAMGIASSSSRLLPVPVFRLLLICDRVKAFRSLSLVSAVLVLVTMRPMSFALLLIIAPPELPP